MKLKDKKVLVVGNARSGIGAAKLAYQQGAKVCIYDGKPYEKWDASMKQMIDQMQGEDFLVYVIMFDTRRYKHNRKIKSLTYY